MSWFTRLIGTDKVLDAGVNIGQKVATGLIDGIDHLKFTTEERAEYNIESSKVVLSFWDRFAKENSEQSKARRQLAVMSFQVYFFLILACVGVWKFDAELATFIFQVIKYLTWLITMIAAAYFVPYQVGSHIKGK
jgi:hypothetical protein